MPELADKRAELLAYAREYPRTLFVETGIYANDCSALALRDRFNRLFVIDLDLDQCIAISLREPKIMALAGDSAELLPRLLAHLDEPAMFWLDAHAISEDEGAPPCPLVAELEAIQAWKHGARSVVLIDDVHGMGTLPTWPTLDGVTEICQRLWQMGIWDDIVRCVPR